MCTFPNWKILHHMRILLLIISEASSSTLVEGLASHG
jgi:hypothetical protein